MSFIKKKNKKAAISSAVVIPKEDILNEEKSEEEKVKPILKPEEDVKEEWIWVDGFKGLDYQMCGHGNFQYELGKTYEKEENDKEIIICHSGFHFCLNLDDVMHYYDYMSNSFTNRYFKVRALVRKSDYEKYGTEDNRGCLSMWVVNSLGYQAYTKIDKLVAKSITILEEIPKEEIWERYIEPNLSNFWYLTKEKYLTNCDDPNRINTWVKETIFENIYSLDITSEDTTSMIVEKLCINVNSSNVRKILHQVLEEIKVLKDLDCGKDMKCCLFYSMLSKYIFTSGSGNSF